MLFVYALMYRCLPPTVSDKQSDVLPAKRRGGMLDWIMRWIPIAISSLDTDGFEAIGKSPDDWLTIACDVSSSL